MKKMTKTIVLVAILGLFAIASLPAADNSVLAGPVKLVYDHYLKIQADLANDSLTGVAENANAIATAVRGDANALPTEVSTQAEALTKAKDLRTARSEFERLSNSLIKYLADHKAKDAYIEVYCPMARASWLQSNRNVNNPYFGPAMSGCGVIKE